jgi:hypothetical protein
MELIIKDVIGKLQSTGQFNFIAVWNNQLERLKNSENYSIMAPAAFVELISDDEQQLGNSYQGYDVDLNIHIISEELDAGDGNIDNFFSIYGLRDIVVKSLSLYEVNMGGFMVKVGETPDYDHDNLYHYIIRYRFHYIDDTAVPEYLFGTFSNVIITKG